MQEKMASTGLLNLLSQICYSDTDLEVEVVVGEIPADYYCTESWVVLTEDHNPAAAAVGRNHPEIYIRCITICKFSSYGI